jgi:reactive intermediate/imine deaminase
MSERVELKPDWPWIADVQIAQGVRVGNTVYVSGQVALDPQGNLVGEGDMAAQTRQVFANIRAVLAVADATIEDVTKITSFITDMSRYGEFAAVRTETFRNNLPASSTVTTPALVKPELLVEIEAIAEIGSGG